MFFHIYILKVARCCSCLGQDWRMLGNMYAQLPTQEVKTKRVFCSVFMVSRHMLSCVHNSTSDKNNSITRHCTAKSRKQFSKSQLWLYSKSYQLGVKLRSCPFCMCKPSVRPTLKPRLDAASDLVTPQVGSSVILSCEAHGVPEPEVTWYKNGLQLAPRNGFEMNRYQLEIVGVQVRKTFDVIHLRF